MNRRERFLQMESSIRAHCSPLHPSIMRLDESHLHPLFASAVNNPLEFNRLIQHQRGDVYSLPLFSDSFARRLIEEIEHFLCNPTSPKGSDIVLEELGFFPFIETLISTYILPHIVYVVYPDLVGCNLVEHYTFVIRCVDGDDCNNFVLWEYVDDDTGEHTTRHVDDSWVTVNACLGVAFTGGSLTFHGPKDGGTRETPSHPAMRKLAERSRGCFEHAPLMVEQVPGMALVHLGCNEHEVSSLNPGGVRYNVILWLRPPKSADGRGGE